MPARTTIFCLTFLICRSLVAQVEFFDGAPLFPAINEWYETGIDKSQVDIMRSIDQPKDQPFQFAIPMQVSLSPANAGFIVRNGPEVVWVMPISSKGALSLNVILSPFSLPEGAYIYVYDINHEILRGAFTNGSSATGTLPVLPVPGDMMVVECHFPGISVPEGAIGVRQVAHDFAGFFGSLTKDNNYGRSGACEVDLNCSTNQNYLRAARSVCRMLVNGTELCTGTLVNNTGTDYKAYVLTAQHCIEDSDDASNTVFVFNYESPWCSGPDQSREHSISGSIFRSSNALIDFSLVELSSFPSLVIRPYFMGWDITSTTPSNTFTLHHPEGDVKKITLDNNPPVTSSYPVAGYAVNSFWRILRWDIGTTELGSSGCPLFDQNGRLRGTLTGGAATCTNPVDDYFAKLSKMFTISTLYSQNLTPWLDPAGTGATIASGRDPYAYNLSLSDTITNISEGDPGQTDLYSSPGFGYSTGFNSDSIIRYAEYIPNVGAGEIAWVHLNLDKSSFLTSADSVVVYIWSGGAQPGTVIASRQVRLQETRDAFDLEVDFGRTIAVTGPFYAGYRLYYKSPLGSAQPQFAVRHSAPYGSASLNTSWFHNGSTWKPFTQHPTFPMPVSLDISVIMVKNSILNSITDPPVQSSTVTVFPNPFTESVSFRVDDAAVSKTALVVFDHSGRVVRAYAFNNIFPGILTLELEDLPAGLYHFRITNDDMVQAGTLIKISDN